MSTPVNILFVEDSENDSMLALRALRVGGFEPTSRRVQTAAGLRTALAQEQWDAVISDYSMPSFTGINALHIFRSTGLDIPFILLSGTIGEETAVGAMKAGASDFIMKESLARLAPALERELKQTQVRAAHRRARHDLIESEERFRQMAENIRDVFFLVDAQSNRMLYVSPAYEEIWGRSCESAYTNPESWAEAMHPADRTSTREKYEQGLAAGTFEFEYRIVRPNGSIRWIGTRGFPVRDDGGKLVRIAGIATDISERKEADRRVAYLAYYDVLTGLANRSLFLERVASYVHSAASGGHKLALYLIDLERFKNLNDTLGQAAGDTLLRQVAEWLARSVGDANLVARVGPDRFAVVCPHVKHEEDVARLLEKTMAVFLSHAFYLNDAAFRIAAKVGVALFPDDAADADILFRNAEAALKKAKASGDRYLFYTQKMTEAVAGRLALENQLRQALDNDEFVLHYQPKVNLGSDKVTGAEALIRWNDPRMGLVPPGQFIPILEETGLIYEVGRWALHKAIEDHLRWRDAGLMVRIAVNVSPLQLRSRGFPDEVRQALAIDAHAAAGLELDITESIITKDFEHSIASLEAIREMGVTIAIDDFGTGFSSLSYLARLPADALKIDRSFMIDMTAGPQGLALVSTIIKLAHSLKLKVVAEGVETEEQSRLLRLLDCDEMQGYLFSKPVPVEIFETRFLAAPRVVESVL